MRFPIHPITWEDAEFHAAVINNLEGVALGARDIKITDN
jgi:hypothetical protein